MHPNVTSLIAISEENIRDLSSIMLCENRRSSAKGKNGIYKNLNLLSSTHLIQFTHPIITVLH